MKFKAVIAKSLILCMINHSLAFGMMSTNYTVSSLQENFGSGARSSVNYQVPADVISKMPVGTASSANYGLMSRGMFLPLSESQFVAGVYINADAVRTNSTSVTLSLICSSPSGCAEVSISNNGVSWSTPEPYTPSKSWSLVANDGERKVFVKYRNGSGHWSGVCSDSITLDRTAPQARISPVSGTFMSPPSVTLTASEPATIHYTLDGSLPTTASPAYTAPVVVNSDATLHCFAVDASGNVGPVASEQYTVCNGSNLTLSGVVKDSTVNKPIPLAIVTLDTGHTTTAGMDGRYSFTSMPRGYYTIASIKTSVPGYVTYQKELMLCKTSVTHDIVLARGETVFGGDTQSGYSRDSVNTSTGNFFYRVTDLAIPGRGFSFSFERAYNSQNDAIGTLGYGWTHNYAIATLEESDGVIRVRWGDGKSETWTPNGTGGYVPATGVFSTLMKNPDNSFTVRMKSMIEYRFDSAKKLTSIQDENSNALTLAYSGANVSSIADASGRSVTFSYDAGGRITRVLDPMDRSVSFTYDVDNNLVSATDLGGKTTRYTYDKDHQLLTVTDPIGNVFVTNTYDEQRRVVASQKDALGGQTLYSYDVAKKTTQIVDPYGHVSYHLFDDMLRLIEEKDALGNSATYAYNERGVIQSVTDKRGYTTRYETDDRGNVLVKTDPLGNRTVATYDAQNNPLAKTDARNNTTTFTYDAKGNLLTTTDPLGKITRYAYDAFGQVITVTDALGNVAASEYDHRGNLVAVTDAMGNRSTFTRDIVGRKLSESHPLGRATAYEYDDMDRLVSVTDALGGVSAFKYDANGNKIEHVDARGNKTTFAYDAKNRLVSKTNPLNLTERYVYDMLDRRISVMNPRGAVSAISHDALGNVTLEINALGASIRHEYDANGNRIRTTDAVGNVSSFVYDALNRVISRTDPLGNTETTTYDPNGNRLTVTDALGKTTQFTYDALNRLITVRDPLGNTTTNVYDEIGRLSSVTDAKGNKTSFEYDALGRTVKVTDAAGGTVTAAYDALSNRTSMTDTRGNTTNYTYDILNRLATETDPLGNASALTYDAIGNAVTLSNMDGTTTSAYDNLNRLTTVAYPDATTVSYTYDANGNRLTVSDPAGVTTSTYDLLDRVASVTDPFGLTVQYTYDPNGNRTSIRYPGNKPVFYAFDALNRLSSVSDWGGVTTTYRFDNAGRLAGSTMGNGATVAYTYDNAGRLTAKEDRSAAGTIIARYTYTLDASGNRTSMTMDQPLIPAAIPVNKSFTYNAGNQIVTDSGAAFTHDGKGNRTGRTDGPVTTQYAYNFHDRLTRVTRGANVDEYTYASDGRRLSSKSNGLETRYLLDLNGPMENVLAEMTGTNTVKKYYIHGDGLLYSIDASTGERRYHHYDALGSTVAITDAQGNITDKYAYHSYGEPAGSETTQDTPFTYVGKFGVMREPNGLYFMRARFYDPATKRFMGKDAVKGDIMNSQTINPYIYTTGKPTMGIDPSGDILIGPLIMLAIVLGCYFGTPILMYATGAKPGVDYVPASSPGGGVYAYGFAGWVESPYKKYLLQMPSDDGSNSLPQTPIDYYLYPGTSVPDYAKTTYEPFSASPHTSTGSGAVMSSGTIYSNYPTYAGRSEQIKNISATTTPYMTDETISSSVNTTTSNTGTPSASISNKPPTPKQFLDVGSKASRSFRREFAKLKDPDFADKQTQSYIEWRIASEIYTLQNHRYGYEEGNKKAKRRAEARMMEDINRSIGNLTGELAQTLSKYSAIIRDMGRMPAFKSGSGGGRGVYAGR